MSDNQLPYELIQHAKLIRRGAKRAKQLAGRSLRDLFADQFPTLSSDHVTRLARHFGWRISEKKIPQKGGKT